MTAPSLATPATAFALLLEMACIEFETLQALIRNEIQVVPPTGPAASFVALRAKATIQMALAKSFLFNANRANRICQKNKSKLSLDRRAREDFLRATKPLTDVRDVNEHGFDGDQRSEKNRPSLHEQEGGLLDETAMVVLGPEKILMGPLNLFEIYVAVDQMRSIAGFRSLPPEHHRAPPAH